MREIVETKEAAIIELEGKIDNDGEEVVSDSVEQYRKEITYLKELIRK